MRFLDDVFERDQELIDYVQRCVGYWLTGVITEQCVFCAFGAGANGKSTFLEAIRFSLGPYAGAAPFSMFEHKNKASIPSDVAATVGKRFITASETDESLRLNESRMKSMTGGDKQVARLLFQNFFEFESSAKFCLAFNHKPEIRDDSHGMWRRIRLIPFNRRFEGSEQDRNLGARLQAEAPGILAWAVRGCLEWQRQGLNEPKTVTDATESYRAESDIIGSFIGDCCSVGVGLSVSSAELWEHFERWVKETGAPPLGQDAGALQPRPDTSKEAGFGRYLHATNAWLCHKE